MFSTNDYIPVVELVVEAANSFLSQYRLRAGAYWASPIRIADGIEFLVSRSFESGRATLTTAYSAHGSPLVGLSSEPLINASNETQIREALFAGEEPPLADEVMATAKEHLNRGRHRNAIVDTATAFEISIVDYLREQLGGRGLSAVETDAALRDNTGRFKSVTSLLKDVLRDQLGVDFVGTAEYQEWRTNIADARNEVVHGGTREVTPEGADLAIATVYRAVEKIRQLASQAT